MRSAVESIWTWIALVTLMVLWVPLLAVIRLFARDPAHYNTGRMFRRLGWAMTKVNPAWRIEVGGETVEDPRHPYVVVCNHLSNADIPIISCLPWDMKWVAKAELLKVPVVGWLMRMAADISVDRKDKRSRARVLITAREYLKNRCSVMFFPEGTRSRDGRLYAFSDGAFRLAIKAQVPILPLVINGTQEALPKHSWKFGAANVKLRVLPPVPTEGLKAADTQALREQVRGAILAQLVEWRGVEPDAVDATLAFDEDQNSAKTPAAAGMQEPAP